MSNRVSALSQILLSPARILAIVLALVFTAEVVVMLVLPHVVPSSLNETGRAVLDAVLLTAACAPALWWIIIGPLRKIAIQEHQRSETIVANASEGIITFDHTQAIVSCNLAGSRILCERDGEIMPGESLRTFIPDLPLTFDALPCDYELEVVRAAGTRLPVQVSISEFPSDERRLLIAIMRDLTEAQQAELEKINLARETEALRTQQMATLAQLATGVAHEIRNPLTSIKMLIQVNRAKFTEEGLPTDDLELVEQEIRRMERSVNGLLDYARPEHTEFTEFLVQDVLRGTVQLIDGRCSAQHVRLQIDAPERPVRVVGDPSQIRQLLLNLSLNALDAMPNGGELKIEVMAKEEEVEIVVGDTGEGISERVTGKLFTPFVTTKPNGVGLGLGICQRIAESHRGTLSGSNRLPRGAQFRLRLPLTTPDNASENGAGRREESCRTY